MTKTASALFDRPFILSMGPQRAGTSWIDRYLRARGDICLPSEVKEIFFFDRHFHRGVEFYKGHFDLQDHHQIMMEVSTTSFDHHDAPRYVSETMGGHVTLLCPLRHPVARSYSLYLHYKRYGMVTGSLRTACKDNPQILYSSRYAEHLQRWFDYYDLDHIHFLFQEDLEEDYESYVAHLCQILGVDMAPVPPEVTGRYNVTTRAPFPVLAKAAQKGADFLRRHQLYAVINAAKAMGLKRMIFGAGGQGGLDDLDQTRRDDLSWLSEQLGYEVDAFESLIGPVPAWASALKNI